MIYTGIDKRLSIPHELTALLNAKLFGRTFYSEDAGRSKCHFRASFSILCAPVTYENRIENRGMGVESTAKVTIFVTIAF